MDHQHTSQALDDPRQLEVAIAAATHHGRRLARSLRLAEADHEDFRQAILMIILTRSARHDARRSGWASFVGLIARHAVIDLARAHHGRPIISPLDGTEQFLADPAACDPQLRLDLGAALADLPTSCRRLAGLIADTGSLADAQRAATMSSTSFYRHVHDLRLRLLMAGLTPPRGKDRGHHPYITGRTRTRRAGRREAVCANGKQSS